MRTLSSAGQTVANAIAAVEPTITYNRCCLRAVTAVVDVDVVVVVVVEVAQYVISTTSSGQHSLHARWLDILVSFFDLLNATTWYLAGEKRRWRLRKGA